MYLFDHVLELVRGVARRLVAEEAVGLEDDGGARAHGGDDLSALLTLLCVVLFIMICCYVCMCFLCFSYVIFVCDV